MTLDDQLGWEIIAALEKAGIRFDYRSYFKKQREREKDRAAWWWRNKSTWDTADFRLFAPIRPCADKDDGRRLRRLHAVLKRIERYAPECLKTFRLILRNRNNRELSIDALAAIRSTHSKAWAAAERTYYNHLKKLLRLFKVQGDQQNDSH